MKHQREHVKALDIHSTKDPPFDKDNPVDRHHIVEILVHAGDLGAQTFKTPLALKWGELVCICICVCDIFIYYLYLCIHTLIYYLLMNVLNVITLSLIYIYIYIHNINNKGTQ
jgi:hypothetical protein